MESFHLISQYNGNDVKSICGVICDVNDVMLEPSIITE